MSGAPPSYGQSSPPQGGYYPRKSSRVSAVHVSCCTEVHRSASRRPIISTTRYGASFVQAEPLPSLTCRQGQNYPPPPTSPGFAPPQQSYPPPPSQPSPASQGGYPPPPPQQQYGNNGHRASYQNSPHQAVLPVRTPEKPPVTPSEPPPPGGHIGGAPGYGQPPFPPEKPLDSNQPSQMPGGAPLAGHFLGAIATQDDVGTFNGGSYRISHRDTNTILTIQLAIGCPLQAKPGQFTQRQRIMFVSG